MKTKLLCAIMAVTLALSSIGTLALADSGYTKANYKIERVDKSTKDANGSYELWYDKVVLTDDNEIAKKINEQIEADCQSFFEANEYDPYSYNFPHDPFYCKTTSEVTQSENGILSIRLAENINVGQSENFSAITFESAMSFNLRTGEKLKLTDVLSMNETEAEDYIKSCTYAHINADPSSFNPNAKELASDTDLKYYDFYVKDDSIFFCWGYNFLASASFPCTTVECPIVKIKVKLNGEYLVFDQPPQIINDRTMVPVRAIFEAMGYTVDWNGAEQTVYADHGTRSIQMTVGSKDMYLSGAQKTFDVSPINLSGRILVPARAVAELSGYMVDWNQDTLTVDIYDWDYMNKNK